MVWLHLRALSKMDKIVTVSNAVKNNLETMLPNANIQTIANSYERTRSPAGHKDISQLKKMLNTGTEKTIFLVAGGLINRKDPLWLISFWQKYFHNDDNKQLVFIGDGPLMSECLNLTSQSTNISLLGHVDNVGDYYDIADVFLSVSHAEGLPNAVIEALSHQTVCMLSSIEPHCEISQSLPHMVHLYELGVEKSLHEAIIGLELQKLHNNKRAEFNTVETTFSVKTMAKQYEELYVSLL
jgi:glycosyltransferase involved in cell wall biosynthesis